jgi:hypothetical protein
MARAGDVVRRDGGSGRGAGLSVEASQLSAAYFVLQAIVGIALWVGYAGSPTLRSWFGLLAAKRAVTEAFAYPDLGVIVVGSLLSAWALASRARRAVPLTAFTAGAVLYPTLFLVGWVAMTRGATGSATLAIMIPPSVLTSWIAYLTWRATG